MTNQAKRIISNNFYPDNPPYELDEYTYRTFNDIRIALDSMSESADLELKKFLPKQIDNLASPYTIDDWEVLILIDASSGPVVLNLPAVSSAINRRIRFKRTDNVIVNAITITPNGLETIDKAVNLLLNTAYAKAHIFSDGTEWWIM